MAFFKSTLFINILWMLGSEAFAKATRILTLVALAYFLPIETYGVAVLALTSHELIRVMTRLGSASRIIQANDADLATLAGNGVLLQWIMCIVVCCAQVALAPYIAGYFSHPELTGLLQLMAFSHLLYPLVSIRVCLIQRENKLKHFSLVNGVCLAAENLTIVVGLLLGYSLYAIAIAKLVAAIIWVATFYYTRRASYPLSYSGQVFVHTVQYSTKTFATEALKILRNQIDILLCAKLFSPEVFGLYSFAKNASIGLSQSINQAFINSSYPHITKALRNGESLQDSLPLYRLPFMLSLLFIAQSFAAGIYIPLIFGDKWLASVPLVQILCLTAIGSLILDITGMIQRALNQPSRETLLMGTYVGLQFISISLLKPSSTNELALIMLYSSLIWLIIPFMHFAKTCVTKNAIRRA